MKNGFTLIEMLVVLAILSIFGTLIVTIFSRTLKGGNKSQIISSIKQNGQAVLETMDKTIRNADNVVCLSNDNRTIIVVKNGTYTRYRIGLKTDISATPDNYPLSCQQDEQLNANGCIIQDNPGKQIISGAEETDPAFVSRVCLPQDTMAKATVLSNTQLQTGVMVVSGSFLPDKSSGYKDQITIRFALNAGVNASAAAIGQIDDVNFQTTIQLR